MSKSRIKIKLPTLTTRDEAEAAMTHLATWENNRRKLVAARDAQVLVINTRYESGLAECAEAVKESSETLRAWAEANPEAFTKGRKSLDFINGTLGFRTGTPKLALLSRAWTWDKVLAELKSRALNNFIRTKEEVDKEAVLAYAANVSTNAESIKRAGIKVVQDESFFVEPALTTIASRQTQEVK